jgi:hypothetical protein
MVNVPVIIGLNVVMLSVTFSIMTISITIRKCDTLHNDIQCLCCIIMLSVTIKFIMLNVTIKLSFVSQLSSLC